MNIHTDDLSMDALLDDYLISLGFWNNNLSINIEQHGHTAFVAWGKTFFLYSLLWQLLQLHLEARVENA